MTRERGNSGAIVAELRRTLDRLTSETDKPSLSGAGRRSLEAEIRKVISELGQFLNDLDPIRQPSSMFDPGNPKIVGRFIALALVAQPRHALSKITPFYGSGVYALYYRGAFTDYGRVSNTETPIYVGQAAPAIASARQPMEQGDRLCRRLEDHRKNISRAASTLSIDDFEFRSLVVQSGWETAAEDYLIHLFRPVWNNEIKILYGLGKHGDSAGTRANKKSPWDTIHPGRAWASDPRLVDARQEHHIRSDVHDHFNRYPPFASLEEVLASFIEELRQV